MASRPDGWSFELFIYLHYSGFNISYDPGKIFLDGTNCLSASHLPVADNSSVVWYLDSNYTVLALGGNVEPYILNPDDGMSDVTYGGLNLYGKIETPNSQETPQLLFKQGEYVAGKFDNSNSDHLIHNAGTIYLALTNLYSAHLLYDDGTNFLEVVPRMLGYHNGGVGVDLTSVPSNAVFIQNSTKNGMTHVATAKGALYATAANGTPKFGTLPVSAGGTGKTTLTSGGIIYGKGTSAVGVTAKGDTSAILVGGNGTPVFASPTVSWIDGTTAGPTYRWSLNGTNFDAVIPSASDTVSGIVTSGDQTFGGHKTFANGITINGQAKFNGSFQIVGGTDAYYNSTSDNSVGSLEVIGGITSTMNVRVDGGSIQFKKAGKIQYDDTKECFNFVFA